MNARTAFDRTSFDALLRRRMFYTESFEIYRKASGFVGDNRGLFDLGPPGCALQANIVDQWRKHFVLEEGMLELDCTILTPEEVFKTSGHVDKFEDWMCKDAVTGEYIRADHLVKAVLESRLQGNARDIATTNDPVNAQYRDILAKLDSFDGHELGEIIKRLDIRNPDGSHEVLPPVPFNLMFKSSVGPSAAAPVYMRPETAQSQFMNFKKLLDYNNGAMPFASASIGRAFRNEISPRSGLLRAREFMMAEIEHFVDPDSGKRHPGFAEVRDVELPLLDRKTQDRGETTVQSLSVGAAVENGIVDNETLGYVAVCNRAENVTTQEYGLRWTNICTRCAIEMRPKKTAKASAAPMLGQKGGQMLSGFVMASHRGVMMDALSHSLVLAAEEKDCFERLFGGALTMEGRGLMR